MPISPRLTTTARRLLRGAGLEVRRWRGSELERHLARLLPVLRPDAVLDVGAHHGESALRFRRAAFDGPVISFEPAPPSFRELERASADDPRWTAAPIALGSSDTEQRLGIRTASWLTSFLPNSSLGETIEPAMRETTETLDVPLRRLDSVLDEYTGGRVFLKIDTQGYDLEVVRGATGVLDRVVGLQLELSVQQVYDGQPDYLDVLKKLRSLGFEPTGLFRDSADPGLRLLEVDAVFAKVREPAVSAVARG
jgi:FkbM family methyltransferase